VLSSLPDTIFFPSGEKATLETDYVCPYKGSPIISPVNAFQMRIVESPLPDKTFIPSGEKTTLETDSVCPING